jgi:uncharacterized protein
VQNARTVLITGASSGIGAAFARALAARQYDLVLVARREDRLISLARELEQRFPIQAEVLVADLANPSGMEQVKKRLAISETLAILVNNAGFGIPGKFAAIPLDQHLAMIQVHVLASVRLCHAALPGMVARGHGAIINVSSIGAFMPKPEDATYCATKAYLKTFSQALHSELHGTGVQVQALCPGFTATEFLDQPLYEQRHVKASIPRPLWMSAENVVAESLTALGRGRVICVPGFKNRFMLACAQLGLTNFLLKWLANRLHPSSATFL